MAKQIRFYVEAVESTSLLDWERRLALRFGGITKYRTQGAYFSQETNRLVFENSYVFEVIAYGPLLSGEPEVQAQQLRNLAGQESVLVVISDVEAKLV